MTADSIASLRRQGSREAPSPSFSARARVRSCSVSDFMRAAAERMCSVCGELSASSALVIMTVSGVLSSCEAAATKSFCSLQARSTGRTAQRERAMLGARKAAKPSAPMTAQVRVSPARVARSLEMSAKTTQSRPGSSMR